MTRHLFPGDLIITPDGHPGASAPFTWWSAPTGGAQYTDCLAQDGASPAPTAADAVGLRAPMYGPDGVEVMFCDTGVGVRFMVAASDSLVAKLDEPDPADQLSALSGVNTAQDATIASLTAQVAALAAQVAALAPAGGVTVHGALSGLASDDHPQYHNDARGDARYYTKAAADALLAAAGSAQSASDRNRANHSGQQSASTISDFADAVNAAVLPRVVVRAAAQGVPTAAQCAALGYPDPTVIVVRRP